MRGLRVAVQRVIEVCLVLAVVAGGIFTGSPGSAQAAGSTSGVNNIYYLSNNDLYRAGTDGVPPVKLQESFTHGWITQVGDYLFYRAEDENFTPLMRISSKEPASQPMKFSNKSILWYQVDGNQIYYMEQSGKIFKTPVAATDSNQAVLVTSMADSNFPLFKIINGVIYFNARKDGLNIWVASKQISGKGSVQWIAKGALTNDKFIHTYQNNIYMMVNTNPHEVALSTDCMVLYIIPIKGNPKNLGIYYHVTEGDTGLYYLGQDADHLLKITEDDITEILAVGTL